MKVLLAPDSFKGCMSSLEVCNAIEKGIKKASDKIDVVQFPSSDGGEGFCDCMRNIFGGETISREVVYPLGNIGEAEFVYNRDTKTAYIELAAASGLSLVPKERRNILCSSTYGTGELIKEAFLLGAVKIIVGLGGSATNDCGLGILYALGMRFFDAERNELKPIAASLDKVEFIDKSKMIDVSSVDFVAACDVKNPLCGPNGAAEVFSRQKGATEEDVEYLDKAANHFADVLGIDPNLQGSGAAGGVGAAMLSVLNAEYVSGASLLVDSPAFIEAVKNADLLITGEGNTDRQTVYGKLVGVVAASAKMYGVKSVVLSGGLSEGYEKLCKIGVSAFYSLVDEEHDLDYCISNAGKLITQKAYNIIKAFL